MLEVVAAVRRVSGRPLDWQAAPRRAGDTAVLVASPQRAERTLGWRTQRSLDECVADAWSWMQGHPAGYPDET